MQLVVPDGQRAALIAELGPFRAVLYGVPSTQVLVPIWTASVDQNGL